MISKTVVWYLQLRYRRHKNLPSWCWIYLKRSKWQRISHLMNLKQVSGSKCRSYRVGMRTINISHGKTFLYKKSKINSNSYNLYDRFVAFRRTQKLAFEKSLNIKFVLWMNIAYVGTRRSVRKKLSIVIFDPFRHFGPLSYKRPNRVENSLTDFYSGHFGFWENSDPNIVFGWKMKFTSSATGTKSNHNDRISISPYDLRKNSKTKRRLE